ncbi:hypothetical protein FisN_15Lh207 [Fistulifera solaris]|uniref:Uncharacterized protein n=1 Tax=Fistulifera solaris TaxID=1519565 RepID=A0A1Z5JEB5_FISSO|nr:hypothetical protein FisN_15Lh207 [Fistulifera solaris]|eukprot:GAX12101.1 hypothetical protein FisN_15Lh207 [Fistulifera solaris]
MHFEDYSTANGRDAEVLSSKVSLKLHRSLSVSDEADILAKAVSQASAAAKSILVSGGSLETASSTAKAAASSVLSPSRSATSGFSGRHLLSRRTTRRQAEIIAAMAVVSARKEVEDQRNSSGRALGGGAHREKSLMSHTTAASVSGSIHASEPHSNVNYLRNTRGIRPQSAAPLFQSDTDTEAGSENDSQPSRFKTFVSDNVSQFSIGKNLFSKRAEETEKPKVVTENQTKTTSLYFRRKKLVNNLSEEGSELARRSALLDVDAPKMSQQQEETTIDNDAQHLQSTSKLPEGSYYDSCSYDEGSEDLSYDRQSDASYTEEQSSSQNVNTTPSLEEGCFMSSIAHVFSCGPTKASRSRPSLNTQRQEARDDRGNPRSVKSREDSRADHKDERSNGTQDVLRELNSSQQDGRRSQTASGRPSPLSGSMEQIVMGVLSTPTFVSSQRKTFHQRIGRGGKQSMDVTSLSNLSADGASETSTFSRASRMRLWSGRRKKVEQPE